MGVEISWIAVIVATVSQFFVGAVWYMVLFSRQWQEIHGMEHLTKKEMDALGKQMGPFYGLQLAMTVLTSIVLAMFIAWLPEVSPFAVASWLWLGLVVPTQVSAVIFGGTEAKWITLKVMIMAGGSLACLMSAAGIINAMQ